MLQLFLKNKIAIGITAVVLAGTAGMTVGGVMLHGKVCPRFTEGGYFLGVTMDEYADAVPERTDFAAGDEISSVSAVADSFVHYEDGALAAMNGMLLTDLGEFSSGLMDSYYLDALMNLQKSDTGYMTDNNGTSLQFDNFLLKSDDTHYLLVSPEFSIEMQNGDIQQTNNGFLELHYLDEEGTAVSLTDGTAAWQFLTENSRVVFANGVVLDLMHMKIGSGVTDETTGEYTKVLALSNLHVDVETNIRISQTSNNVSWEPPTFIVNAVDGTDGEDGSDGENGAEGTAGSDGDTGKTGTAGVEGAAGGMGTHGGTGTTGVAGISGKDGENSSDTDGEDTLFAPCINVISWEQNAGSVKFTICVYNTSLIQEGSSEAYLLNTDTGQVVYTWSNLELKTENDGEEIPLEVDILQPNTGYKLVMSARVLTSVDLEGTASYGKSVLLSRSFRTDENGFYLQKVQSAYITDEELDQWSDQERAVTGASMGLKATISGSQKIKEIRNVQISYVNEDGERVVLSETENPLANAKECELLRDTSTEDTTYYLFGLRSNTNYTISLEAEMENGRVSQITETYLTLKATPTLKDVVFDVNEHRFFISSIRTVEDPDNAITGYTHEIYRYIEGDGLTGDCLKTKVTADSATYIYLNDEIKEGNDSNGQPYYYGNKIYVTYNDNEKQVTREIDAASDWRAQTIDRTDSSYIVFQEEEITTNSIKGKVKIYTGSGSTIYVGDNDFHRILVQTTSSGYSKVSYYDSLEDWKNDAGESMKGTDFQGSAWTELDLDGLAPDTTYVITVTAYFDAEATSSQTVGSTVVKTNAR